MHGLIEAICDNPDDDVPRLIYADYLDDQGDADRAEFIRLQCRLAKIDLEPTWHWSLQTTSWTERKVLQRREKELYDANDLSWEMPLLFIVNPECQTFTGPSPWKFEWRRGFVHAISLPWFSCRDHLSELLNVQPIQEVTLTTVPDLKEVERLGSPRYEALEEFLERRWPKIKVWNLTR